jgi:Kef-type K+ transport system membrane component KefB/Trk K+ transport system NAD-binding subunit
MNLLYDIGIIIILATVGGYVARLLRQPLIPAYIVMGILLGPVLGVVHDAQTIMTLSEIGIAFLLFSVGLELDVRKLKDMGDVVVIGGAAQCALMFGLGYLCGRLLGFVPLSAIYLGLVVSFSSTMVVIKLLSDKYELDTLHGRIIIGTLLLQDLLAILAISMLRTVDGGWTGAAGLNLLLGAVLLVVSFFLGKWLFPPLFRHAAKSLEMLFLLAVSVCFLFALLFQLFGFSIAVGAFLGGVILGNLPYNIEIVSRVRPLKDFFGVLFFSTIGLLVSFANLQSMVPVLLVLFALTVIVSPLLTILLCSLFGYTKRTAFLTGLNMSQVSEFALILALGGLAAGHITQPLFSAILGLTILTIMVSAYLSKYEDQLYALFGRFFTVFERLSTVSHDLENMSEESRHDVVLVGYDRTAYSIFRTLRRMRKDFVVVDFDPDVVRHLLDQNVPCIYGDIGDPEVLEKLRLHQVRLVISTIPNFQENMLLVQRVKRDHSRANIIVTSYQAEDALELYSAGADYVIIPHFLGGEHVSYMLEDITTNLDKLINAKLEHIRELRTREELRPRRQRR